MLLTWSEMHPSFLRQIEALEGALAAGADPTLLQDEARSLYSQIRMWGKEGETRSKDSLLGWLDDLFKS